MTTENSRCIAITSSNQQCRRNHVNNSNFCWQHLQITETKEVGIVDQIAQDVEMLTLNQEDPAVISDLETMIAEYSDLYTYFNLIEYNPKKYNLKHFLTRNDIDILEAIEHNLIEVVKKKTSTQSIMFQPVPTIIGIGSAASLKCLASGGSIELRTVNGKQYGICVFADETECEEWVYFRNECPNQLKTFPTITPADYFLLDYSVNLSRYDIFVYFVSIGMPVTINTLLLAAKVGSLEIFKYIVDTFYLDNKTNFSAFRSALETSITNNSYDIVQYLIFDRKIKVRNNLDKYLKLAADKPRIYEMLHRLR